MEFKVLVKCGIQPLILSASPKQTSATMFQLMPTLLTINGALLIYTMAVLAWRQWSNVRRAEW